MKKYFILTIACAMVGLTLMSNSSHPSNNPNVGNRSGVLGMGTEGCNGADCHNNTDNLPQPSISIKDASGNVIFDPSGYLPNKIYFITLSVDASSVSGSYPKWGFQLSAKTANNNDAGTFFPATGIITDISGGYGIAEQNQPIPSVSNNKFEQTIQWLSPGTVGTNKVTFYTSILASNDDGFATGDQYVTKPREVKEIFASGINDVSQSIDAGMSPNPCTSSTSIRINGSNAGQLYTVSVYNAAGSISYKTVVDTKKSQSDIPVSTEGFAPGLYFVRLTDTHGASRIMPLVKQ